MFKTNPGLKRFVTRLMGVGLLLVVASFILMPAPRAHAATGINHQINFQGKLVNPNGTNVTDGSYSIVFSIYNVANGGAAIWTETQSVTVTTGIFQVNLGSVTPLPGSVDFNTDNIYLGIKVGADAEMTPRVQFTAVPQAFNAEKLGGLDKSGFIQNQTASPQNASFNINGTAAIGSTLSVTGNTSLTTLSASGVITSTVATGTAPLTVASATKVTNLNADLLDGLDSTAFASASGSANYIQNGTSPQSANFNITGNGTVGGTLTIGTATGSALLNIATAQAALGATGVDGLSVIAGMGGNSPWDLSRAGNGGALNLQGGTGGSMAPGSGGDAGNGGSINLTAGAGGNSNFGYQVGSGGNIILNGGAAGTNLGNGKVGTAGNVILANLQGSVGIGTTTPGYKLDVQGGDVNTSGAFRINGVAICTSTGCNGNATTLQGGYTASVGGTTPEIKLDSTRGGLDIQDADTSINGNLLTVRASNSSGLGATLLSVNSTGKATFQNSVNSTSALQIQNASGASVLTVDTTNNRVGIGTATPGQSLQITSSSDAATLVQTTNGTLQGSSMLNNGYGTASNNSSIGSVAWINPGNATALDSQDATVTNSGTSGIIISNYLKLDHLGLRVPAGATVTGVSVSVRHEILSTAIKNLNYTGSAQTFTVPAGVTSLNLNAFGGAGGTGSTGVAAGLGGNTAGTISVTPGQVLTIVVGGQGANATSAAAGTGGYGGGGNGGGTNSYYGGGGGGSTYITDSNGNLLALAAGGGGGGYGEAGAAGGGYTGGTGTYEGAGGTQTAGGAGGNGGGTSGSGSYLTGGTGGPVNLSGSYYGGGGGGGGYYGGGGGYACQVGYGCIGGGGGGGSAYVPAGGTTTSGVQSGNGKISISYTASTTDNNVSLVNSSGALAGNNKASGSAWASAYQMVNYGSSSDSWGLSLTGADVDSPNFGVAIAANVAYGTVGIDQITVQVNYATTSNTTIGWTTGLNSGDGTFSVSSGADFSDSLLSLSQTGALHVGQTNIAAQLSMADGMGRDAVVSSSRQSNGATVLSVLSASSNPVLSVDVTNSRVGIGTAQPIQALQLTSANDTVMLLQTTGGYMPGTTVTGSLGTYSNDSSAGSVIWTNPGNARTVDSSYATVLGTGGTTSNYLKLNNLGLNVPVGAVVTGISLSVTHQGPTQTITNTLSYTGNTQTFTVPAGVTSINITANGAAGGGTNGTGVGGQTTGSLSVTPGQTLTIVVGGQGGNTGTGGYGGGGSGSGNADGSGGGGGATYVMNNQGTLLLLAGGGGGSGGRSISNAPGGPGASGGGLTGNSASSGGLCSNGAGGGTQTAGGIGGSGNSCNVNGGSGSYLAGGAATTTASGKSGGGGGGGGYYGGGAGGGINSSSAPGTGGGGGSAYVPAGGATTVGGGSTTNGSLVITYSTTTTDNTVSLVNASGAVVGNNKASATAWSSSGETVSYGGTSDTWGLSLTGADVDSPNFGVVLAANLGIGTSSVDQLAITIYYTASSNNTFNWSTGVNHTTNEFNIAYGSDLTSPLFGITKVGNLQVKGTVTGGIASPDYAENITISDPSIEAADVVSMDPAHAEHVVKSSVPYDSHAVGVISTHPGFVTNATSVDGTDDPTQRPLALSGRVPVKVSTENGIIQPGDYLTSSSTPGYAMKATQAGQVIGRAMAAFDGSDGTACGNYNCGTVLLFIDNSYYNPATTSNMQGSSLSLTGDATIGGNLTVVGSISTTNVTINGHIITAGATPLVAALAAAGKNAAVTVVGNDVAGTITITSGDEPVAGDLLQLTFATKYATAPVVLLTANGQNAATVQSYVNESPDSFTIGSITVLRPTTTYVFNYHSMQ